MYDNLNYIKEQLHDAPVEVKEAFNTVVGYFDTEYFGVLSGVKNALKGAGQTVKSLGIMTKYNKLKLDIEDLQKKIDDLKEKKLDKENEINKLLGKPVKKKTPKKK